MKTIRLSLFAFLLSAPMTFGDPPGSNPPKTWPQAYSVTRDAVSGTLTLRTPYYTLEQDLKRGGALSRTSGAWTRGAGGGAGCTCSAG